MCKHPIMKSSEMRVLGIPDLNGGLNMRDGLSKVMDNQLTECRNMWYRDGILKSRAGVKERAAVMPTDSYGELAYDFYTDHTDVEDSIPTVKRHNCYNTENGRKGQLCSVLTNALLPFDPYGNGSGTEYRIMKKVSSTIHFFWCYGDENIDLSDFKTDLSDFTAENDMVNITNYFVAKHKGTLYLYLKYNHYEDQGENEYEQNWVKTETRYKVYKYVKNDNDEYSWELIPQSDIYVPLVAPSTLAYGGIGQGETSQLEGYNILSDYYKITFIPFNANIAVQTSDVDNTLTHKMTYLILKPVNDEKYSGMQLKVKVTKGGAEYNHSITLNGGVAAEPPHRVMDTN